MAWSHLTSSYRGDQAIFPDGYQSYTDWWNTVESVTPSQPQILERNHQTATVELTLTLAMNSGEVSTEQRRVQLIWNSPQNAWEIAKNTRL